jgi:hypothetical protein
VITRGRLLDRMRVAVAGSLATKMVLGEDTNFNIADIKRVRRMAERYVFYYGEGGGGGSCFRERGDVCQANHKGLTVGVGWLNLALDCRL